MAKVANGVTGTMDTPVNNPLVEDADLKSKRNEFNPTMGEYKPKEGKFITTIGLFVHLLFVAIPKDIYLWLTRRRKDVRGQTIVITGAGSGIGQRMAEIFAIDLGAKVAILDIDGAKAEQAAQMIRDKNAQAAAFQCDVTNPKAIESCATNIKEKFGRQVDIVVCNAAILYFAHALELTSDQLQRAFNVNVMGVLNTVRAFLPDFERENRGQIVAMSSIAGFYGETYGLAYCPSKFAVRGIMECLQMEFRDRGLNGIKCTTLCPYFVRTPMILNMGMRPTSKFIPFMSINRCSQKAVHAILLEKVSCFIPGYVCIAGMIKNVMTYHVQKAMRNFLDCRYVPISTLATQSPNGGVSLTTPNSHSNLSQLPVANQFNSDEKSGKVATSVRAPILPEMANYFKVPALYWWLIIPPALFFTFIVYYNVNWIPTQHLWYFGKFLHILGTRYNWVVLMICIGAAIAHLAEATYVLYMCDSLGFTHVCALKWFVQTLILGYPSTILVRRYKTKMSK
ncbi:Epidermal retinol dehydrogenase 2 [Aphelenchoides besseyi]|nr:Epidermal retinol dehydrogenase 2 [Aphelenchoides besseyi]